MKSSKYTTVHYRDYLHLDKILNAQKLRSEEVENQTAHDEMLFIIVHQSYELWFKQIIHELTSVIDLFDSDMVDERNLGMSIDRLNRVGQILYLLIEHIRIMETMTPLDFLDFRNHLFPASGFQSYQFRKIENLLGLAESQRITFGRYSYTSAFSWEEQEELQRIAEGKNLFTAIEGWLERTPFLQFGEFKFLETYREAVKRMLENEEAAINQSDFLNDHERDMRLKMLKGTDSYFQSVLDPAYHENLIRGGRARLSYKASVAALLINLYREEPLLQLPFRLLVNLVDIDESLTTWRYRHAQMVLRMLGRKIGTGGSSGHDYLQRTAAKHHIFSDLHNISTLLIPRSELPELPPEIKRELSFHYTVRRDQDG